MRGSPIRKSSDQRSVDSSPRLIAASYVLHRLLVPRHPPCALNNLATQKSHPTHPRKEAMRRAYKNSYVQSQKMLASTVQFSTYDQTPPTRPRQTHALPQEAQRYEKQEGPDTRSNGPPGSPGGSAPSGPNSVPTTRTRRPGSGPRTPRRACSTGSPRRGPAELVSVPPSSTTPGACGPPQLAGHRDRGAALDHQHEAGGQCSLERR